MSSDSEILTVSEVADMLRLSERTVYEWAQNGRIPCGKIGNAWRFKRSDVTAWIDRNLSPRRPGSDVAIEEVLTPARIIVKASDDKLTCLHELTDRLSQSSAVLDREALEQGILKREQLMSTGIGLGCAVPHVRIAGVTEPVMAVGIYKNGITGYESLDDIPVRVIFAIVAGIGQHEQHLRLLSMIARRAKTENLIDILCAVSTPEDAFAILTRQHRKEQ